MLCYVGVCVVCVVCVCILYVCVRVLYVCVCVHAFQCAALISLPSVSQLPAVLAAGR